MSETSPSLELRLRRPPLWSPAFLSLIAGCVIGTAFPLLQAIAAGGDPRWNGVYGILMAGLVCTAIAVRFATRTQQVPPIRVYPDHLQLPRHAGSRKTRTVRYEEILSLHVLGEGSRAKLLLGTRRKLFSYPVRAFIDRDAPNELRSEVHRLLELCANGPSLLAAARRREALGKAAWGRKPVVSLVLLGAIATGFAFEQFSGVLDQPFELVRYGANAPVLVRDGQLFRLAAANFLHASPIHVYLNAIALYSLGVLLERLLGPWRIMVIFLVGAAGGSLTSSLFAHAAFSVGASTAIFGLLGSLAVINSRFRGDLPGGFRQTVRWWISIIGLNAILPVLVPEIDFAAHVGGFLAGALSTAVLCRTMRSIDRRFGATPFIKVAALSLVAVFSLGLVQAERYARSPQPGDEDRVARLFVASSRVDSTDLNDLAWQFATAPFARLDQLEIAKIAAERAVSEEPNHAGFLDTLATVYYRQGQFDLAVATERLAVGTEFASFKVSQLARFLAARMNAIGPVQIGDPADASSVSIEIERSGQPKEKRAFRLSTGSAYREGAVIYALSRERDRLEDQSEHQPAYQPTQLQGVLRIVVGPNLGPLEQRLVLDSDPSFRDVPEDVQFDIALVDTTGCDACEVESSEWKYWPIDAEVRKLP